MQRASYEVAAGFLEAGCPVADQGAEFRHGGKIGDKQVKLPYIEAGLAGHCSMENRVWRASSRWLEGGFLCLYYQYRPHQTEKREMSAFTHIVLGTNNLSNSTKFYDATLGALGLKNMGLLTEDNSVQYGVNTPEFMI